MTIQTSQSNAVVSSKFSFTFSKLAQHELVMLKHKRRLSARLLLKVGATQAVLYAWSDDCSLLRLRCTLTRNWGRGKMQSPRQTTVQALRNTRLVEEICAWIETSTQFLQTTFMPGWAAR